MRRKKVEERKEGEGELEGRFEAERSVV